MPGSRTPAAIDLSDRHGPALFMTSDFGATWHEIVNGLPADVPSRVIREDPVVPSLLYAGTQQGIFVSFDRGRQWQPLQLNLPRVPVLDITVHEKDLIIATWGRALWALDDVSPLRQIDAVRDGTTPAYLFAPSPAVRVRWDNNQDTPLPPEVPQGQNPPDGAMIDYYLRSEVTGPVTIAIRDVSGSLVREYANVAPPPDTRMPNVAELLVQEAGDHIDDSRHAPPGVGLALPDASVTQRQRRWRRSRHVSYGIIAAAIIGESPKQQPVGSLVLPGTYEIRFTVGDQTLTRQLTVTNDPRSEATAADLALAAQIRARARHWHRHEPGGDRRGAAVARQRASRCKRQAVARSSRVRLRSRRRRGDHRACGQPRPGRPVGESSSSRT